VRGLLIVEDEKWEREGLVDFIDWSAFGIGGIHAAENGIKGLELARRHSPDIVITDIKMPRMDGLSLGKELRKILPECVIILVSGYDDFAFAREAIDFGGFDYLLKPVQREDLLAAMTRASDLLDSRRSRREAELALRGRLLECGRERRERLLRDIVAGRGGSAENLALSDELNATLFRRGVVAIALKSDLSRCIGDRDGLEWKARRASLLRSARSVVADDGIVARSGDGIGGVLACLANRGREFASDTIARILEEDGDRGAARTAIGVGEPRERMEDFHASYEEARLSLDRIFLEREAAVAFFADSARSVGTGGSSKEASPSRWIELRDELPRRMRSFEASPDSFRADDVFEYIKAGALSRGEIREFLAGMLGRIALSIDCDADLFADFCLTGAGILETMDCFTTLGRAQDWFLGVARFAIGRMREGSARREWRIAEEAMEIIRKEYRSNIGIRTIADRLGVSANYLGNLFNRHAGKPFTEALTDYRMERAEELLSAGSDNVGAVARAVGYGSPGYFASVYKRRHGMSPMEWQRGRAGERRRDESDA
jgi:two-component system, response regulator YesN